MYMLIIVALLNTSGVTIEWRMHPVDLVNCQRTLADWQVRMTRELKATVQSTRCELVEKLPPPEPWTKPN